MNVSLRLSKEHVKCTLCTTNGIEDKTHLHFFPLFVPFKMQFNDKKSVRIATVVEAAVFAIVQAINQFDIVSYTMFDNAVHVK